MRVAGYGRQREGRVDVVWVEGLDSGEAGFAGGGVFVRLQEVQDVQFEACAAGLCDLAFEVAAQDS